MNNVQDAINAIIQREGGFVNHPNDSGGPTNFGITLETYRKYKKGATINDLVNMNRSDAFFIYESKYYKEPHIDLLAQVSESIANEVLDAGINIGPETAISFLQRSLNVFNRRQRLYADISVDGNIGPNTLSALTKFLKIRGNLGEVVMRKALNCLRGNRYIELAEKREANESFVYGWLNNRVDL